MGKALAGGKALPKTGLSFAHMGRAKLMVELRQRLEQVSRLKQPLLLSGEAGCGFEMVARVVHQKNTAGSSPDHGWLAHNPFAPLTEARDGILFLDQLERLNKAEQKGLLQLIAKLDKFNVRLIVAAALPLLPLVESGDFDAALLTQLSGVTLRIPSLREHPEDIPDLANTILLQMVEANECPLRQLNVGALNALRNLDWPGNLPMLQNAIKDAGFDQLE